MVRSGVLCRCTRSLVRSPIRKIRTTAPSCSSPRTTISTAAPNAWPAPSSNLPVHDCSATPSPPARSRTSPHPWPGQELSTPGLARGLHSLGPAMRTSRGPAECILPIPTSHQYPPTPKHIGLNSNLFFSSPTTAPWATEHLRVALSPSAALLKRDQPTGLPAAHPAGPLQLTASLVLISEAP